MKELEKNDLILVDGGFLPLAYIIGIGIFQIGCCIVALGMKARLDQEQSAVSNAKPDWAE